MKYLRSFNENINRSEIDAICKEYEIKKYTINDDGSIDVTGDVDFTFCNLRLLPIKFRNVYGDFACGSNELVSLEGAPNYLFGNFTCEHNNLIDLKGSPERVIGDFNCSDNKLISLEGAPQYVGVDFNCSVNNLTNLNYCPTYIGFNFNCSQNELETLNGCPQIIYNHFNCENNSLSTLENGPNVVNGSYNCSKNNLTSMKGLPKTINDYLTCENNKIKSLNYFPKYKDTVYLSGNPIHIILRLFLKLDFVDNILSTTDNKNLIYDFNDREIIQNDIVLIDRLIEFLEDIEKPHVKDYLQDLLQNEYEIR